MSYIGSLVWRHLYRCDTLCHGCLFNSNLFATSGLGGSKRSTECHFSLILRCTEIRKLPNIKYSLL